MNCSDYAAKMDELLWDSAYKKLKCNPTIKIEARIASTLNDLEQKGHLSTKQQLALSPSFPSVLHIYGLPKSPQGLPLQPSVSAIGSCTHRLARELVRILKPLSGSTDSHVKDSSAFVEWIGQTTMQENDLMVSFDVASLFTRVPVDGPLQVIAELLHKDQTLPDWTTIPAPDLMWPI